MSEIRPIRQNCMIPSSALTIPRNRIKTYCKSPDAPRLGDLVYGEVTYLGQQRTLESASGRIHTIHDRTRAVFAFGNHYAPDDYESLIPTTCPAECDLVARSGLIGEVREKNALIADPTRIRILGYICTDKAERVNTRDRILIRSQSTEHSEPGARIILCIGTAMNSGKSQAAATCCYALASKRKDVRAAKITGTASLKDILLMEDCGARHVADFTYLGYPSTYLLDREQLKGIFQAIHGKYGNNPKNYLVVEIADGILQRETAMLLQMPEIRKRLHKIVFCAQDAAGAIGGLRILKEHFEIIPDAISGICSSSPLALQELAGFTNIPILDSTERNFQAVYDIIR